MIFGGIGSIATLGATQVETMVFEKTTNSLIRTDGIGKCHKCVVFIAPISKANVWHL